MCIWREYVGIFILRVSRRWQSIEIRWRRTQTFNCSMNGLLNKYISTLQYYRDSYYTTVPASYVLTAQTWPRPRFDSDFQSQPTWCLDCPVCKYTKRTNNYLKKNRACRYIQNRHVSLFVTRKCINVEDPTRSVCVCVGVCVCVCLLFTICYLPQCIALLHVFVYMDSLLYTPTPAATTRAVVYKYWRAKAAKYKTFGQGEGSSAGSYRGPVPGGSGKLSYKVGKTQIHISIYFYIWHCTFVNLLVYFVYFSIVVLFNLLKKAA